MAKADRIGTVRTVEQMRADAERWLARWEIDEDLREGTHLRSRLRFGVRPDGSYPVVLNEWEVGFDGICDLEVAIDEAHDLIVAGYL